MQGQESGGAGDLDVGEKMPERKAAGELGGAADRGGSLGSRGAVAPVLHERRKVWAAGGDTRQAALQGDGSVAASALGRLSTSLGDFDPGQPALLILVQASRLSGYAA